jgi:hypothetical protein
MSTRVRPGSLDRDHGICRAWAYFSSRARRDRAGEIDVKRMAVLLLATGCAMPALACDQVDAAKLQSTFAEMGATWSEQGGAVRLDWGRAWDGTAAVQRLALLRAFAQADACLAGRTRPIAFHRQGRLVASAAPGLGVRLLDEPRAGAAACP